MGKLKTKREALKLGKRVIQSLIDSGLVTEAQAKASKIIYRGHKNKVKLRDARKQSPHR